jgi:hypothetical protein
MRRKYASLGGVRRARLLLRHEPRRAVTYVNGPLAYHLRVCLNLVAEARAALVASAVERASRQAKLASPAPNPTPKITRRTLFVFTRLKLA